MQDIASHFVDTRSESCLGELLRLKIPSVVTHTASGFNEGPARALIFGLSKRKKDTHYIHGGHFAIYIIKSGAIY